MSTATSPLKFTIAVAALISWSGFCLGGMGSAAAQSLSDEENGRYTLSPVADGVIRLDTRTGAVSTCSNTGAGWACHVVPDERAALDAEIGRLQAENEGFKTELEQLKAELAAREPNRCPRRTRSRSRSRRWPRGSAKSKFHCRATAIWTG